MKYADIEGLEKKDPFKKGFVDIFKATTNQLLKHRIRILPESLGEPAALLDFLDYDFLLAFKTDGVGTKSLIADAMSSYSGIGIDLIASNVNDLICLGATPIALSDEIAAGHYKFFTDTTKVKQLYAGLKQGCLKAGITIPSGESPTLVDIIREDTVSLTASAIGIIKPKSRAIFGQDLQAGDLIFGLASSGIHTNGLSLARKPVKSYFTPFGKTTLGKELLTPTRIYVRPILEMLAKNIDIHYMSHISGSAFKKIMRAKQPFTYVIDQLLPVPKILQYLQTENNIPDSEAYETWNMGLGFVIFAPKSEEKAILKICSKYKVEARVLGHVKSGPKQVIIKPLQLTYHAH